MVGRDLLVRATLALLSKMRDAQRSVLLFSAEAGYGYSNCGHVLVSSCPVFQPCCTKTLAGWSDGMLRSALVIGHSPNGERHAVIPSGSPGGLDGGLSYRIRLRAPSDFWPSTAGAERFTMRLRVEGLDQHNKNTYLTSMPGCNPRSGGTGAGPARALEDVFHPNSLSALPK
jgi:hypothetical protein